MLDSTCFCPSTVAQQKVADEFAKFIEQNRGDGCGILLVDGPDCRFELCVGRLSSFSVVDADFDTRFEIASVAKMMIAYCILNLVSEDKLTLDSEARDFLALEGIGTITVRDLLTHKSGLPDYWNDGPEHTLSEWSDGLDRPSPFSRPLSALWCWTVVLLFGRAVTLNSFMFKSIASPLLIRAGSQHIWDPKEVLQIALQDYKIAAPGKYHYSDTNYLILGLILEIVRQKPLHQVLDQEIFVPQGMRDTYLRYDSAAQVDRGADDRLLSTRYRSKGKWRLGMFAWTFPDYSLGPLPVLTVPPRYVSADWASGGVVSTARDLCVFMRAVLRDQDRWNMFTTSMSDSSYGFGIKAVAMGEQHGVRFGHAGNGGACLYYWPKYDVVFAGTTNNNVSNLGNFVEHLIVSGLMLPCLEGGAQDGNGGSRALWTNRLHSAEVEVAPRDAKRRRAGR